MSNFRLETRGRKTNLPHIVELRYVNLRGSFFALSGAGRSDWVLNALHSGGARVRLADHLFEVSARLVTGEERSHVVRAFEQKYGRRLVSEWYSGSAACLSFTQTGPSVRRGASTGESDTAIGFSDWKEKKLGYYADIAAAFDSASEEYDFTIGRNYINTWIRRRSIDVLRGYIRDDDALVEIGCGTGSEAVEIAKYVRTIVATDVSQKMVDLLATKVKARGIEGRILPMRLGATEIDKVGPLLDGGTARLAYSFNGALNCEPRIHEFVERLADLLAPGGIFVCSVRNTICLTEMLAHAAVFQFSRMNPRKKQPVMVSVGGRDIPSRYYPPDEFLRMFTGRFELREMIALPGLLPPAYLNDYYLGLGRLTGPVETLERALSGHFPLNRFGDQTLFVLQKRP